MSYKSYEDSLPGNDVKGLFYFFDFSPEEFEEHLKYGDINLQIPCSLSVVTIKSISLCYLKDAFSVTFEALLSVPFTTRYAYIATDHALYYVDKQAQNFVLVFNQHLSFLIYSLVFQKWIFKH